MAAKYGILSFDLTTNDDSADEILGCGLYEILFNGYLRTKPR